MNLGDPSYTDHWIKSVGYVIEVFGVFSIVLGGSFAGARYVWQLHKKTRGAYGNFRKSLGRAILLGLEFLVAGDIIGTVAVEPTFQNLGILGVIVLIRTFLSFSLEVEIKGRWPWQNDQRHESIAK